MRKDSKPETNTPYDFKNTRDMFLEKHTRENVNKPLMEREMMKMRSKSDQRGVRALTNK